MAQCNGLIAPGCPFYTGVVSCHHNIIIIMEIDDDLMAKIPNNQPHFDHPWSAMVGLVGDIMVGLNGMV